MEKLIYTNKAGQTIEFSATSKYKWQKVDDIGGLESVSQSIQSPYQDGSTGVGDSYFSSKVISVEFVVTSESLDEDMRTLYSILNPKLGIATLTVVNDGKHYIFDKVKTRMLPSRPGGKDRGKTFQITKVIFEVYNPYLQDFNYTEIKAISGASTFNFPVAINESFRFGYFNQSGFNLNNVGDAECPLNIIIDGPQSSPLTITKVLTNEKIVIGLNLTVDERLVISTSFDDINVIKYTLSTAEFESAFEYIDVAQTDFFQLALGDNNIAITANASEIGTATLKFRNRYVGV